jgi:multiple sugar transport system permease protein
MSQQVTSIPMSVGKEKATVQAALRGSRRVNGSSIGAMTFLIICTVYFLVPFFWLIISATKNESDLFNTFGFWFAPNFNLWSNLQQLFSYGNGLYVRWLLNSLLYAGVGAIVGTFLAAMAGYALAKYVFKGRDLIFSMILGAILIPATVLALPLYLMMSAAGMSNTIWSVLLPSLVSPFGVYLSRIYASSSVPDELLEAARIDGAGEFRTFTTIAMRLMVPALVTILLFQFVTVWNNYFLPLIMLSNEKLFPITVGLETWNVTTGGANNFLYPLIISGALVSSIPLLIGCILLQRYWRGGLGTGSVKG